MDSHSLCLYLSLLLGALLLLLNVVSVLSGSLWLFQFDGY